MAEARNGDVKRTASSISSNGYEINLDAFSKRLREFYTNWRVHKQEPWGGAEAIAVANPPTCEDFRYLKSSALQTWLLGYEFPETVMMFMGGRIHFLCSQENASLLEELKKVSPNSFGIDISLHVKPKNNDGSSQMQEIFQSVKTHCTVDPPVVGWIAKEAPEGPLLEKWGEALKDTGFHLVDIGGGFSELFARKDETEITNIKRASGLCASVLNKNVRPKLKAIIDEEEKVTHSSLMEDTENVILNPGMVKVKLKADNVDVCYAPVFQSGGVFDLRPGAESNDEHLCYDSTGVIICSIGSRYKGYCSNIARTYIIEPDKVQKRAYKVLLKAHEAAITSLQPGNTAATAYKAAAEVVWKDGPEFLPHLTKIAGTGIGIEFRETGLNLNAKNDKVLDVGMVFNVSLGFRDLRLQSNNPKTQVFSLLLSDTVIITEKGPEIATGMCSKSFSIYSNDHDEEPQNLPKPKVDGNGMEPRVTKTLLRSGKQDMIEEVHRQHQAGLTRQKNEETARRFAVEGPGSIDGQGSSKATDELVAYKNVEDIPFSRDLMIQIDHKNEAVLLPVYGLMVPFHISTIKSVTSQKDGGSSCIHVIFNIPGAGFDFNDVYLKGISFRSKDTRHVNQVVQLVKALLRRHVLSRESMKSERVIPASQEKLQLSKPKTISLSDLLIRPSFGGRGRKMTGTLEGHLIGFHYSTMKQEERVDIKYKNIKHAIFQPAEKETIALIHFHLHNHIMVGNNKTKDVQFYAKVRGVIATSGSGKRSVYDPDEAEVEQQERDNKNKLNADFNTFVMRMSELWKHSHLKDLQLVFDIPSRELGFQGVPYKACTFVIPTGNCLVELLNSPFLVITLSEIEIVNLERARLGESSFDMAIVFKDFRQEVFLIGNIPFIALDGIKVWLNSLNLKYYESIANLEWQPILKTIMADPEQFIKDGGWEFLNLEVSDSDSDNSKEFDGSQPSEIEEESETDEEDSDNASVVESEDEDEDRDLEEEEGKTWYELEAKERNTGREHGDGSDSEEKRLSGEVKSAAKSRLSEIRCSPGMPAKRLKVS